jgi:CubicO group peptidase (beta-lactamase class C family)
MLYGFGSITKTFVAAIVLQLVEENRLGLEDRLEKWLDKYPNIDTNITVHQLLNHTSGLGGYIIDVEANLDRIWSPEEILKYVASPSAPPGDGTRYSNTNYMVTGNPVEQELEDRIIGPLSLNSTSLPKSNFEPQRWANSTVPSSSLYSAVWTAGALASTSRDVAKWGHTLFSGTALKWVHRCGRPLLADFDPFEIAAWISSDFSLWLTADLQSPEIDFRLSPGFGHFGQGWKGLKLTRSRRSEQSRGMLVSPQSYMMQAH